MGDVASPAEQEAVVRRAGTAAFPGFRLVRLARTASSQDVVRAAAASGAPEGFCCAVAEQTAGRGRNGRRWVAAAGTSLLASLLLRRDAGVAVGVPLAAGLAVAKSVERLAGVECHLKWPNDVLAGGGKLAGILTEVEPGGGTVLGVGVNLAVTEFPPGVAGASLHRLSRAAVTWDALLAEILTRLAGRIATLEAGGIPALQDDWTGRAAGLGEQIRAEIGGRTVVGTARGIDDQGALLVTTPEGQLRLIAGDVHLLGPA